jgi:hypothetical protein
MVRARYDARIDPPAAIEALTSILVELEGNPFELRRDVGAEAYALVKTLLAPGEPRRAALERMMVRAGGKP